MPLLSELCLFRRDDPSYVIPEKLAKIREGAVERMHAILSGAWKKTYKNVTDAYQDAWCWVWASYVDFPGVLDGSTWYDAGDPIRVRARRILNHLKDPSSPPRQAVFLPTAEQFLESVKIFSRSQK